MEEDKKDSSLNPPTEGTTTVPPAIPTQTPQPEKKLETLPEADKNLAIGDGGDKTAQEEIVPEPKVGTLAEDVKKSEDPKEVSPNPVIPPAPISVPKEPTSTMSGSQILGEPSEKSVLDEEKPEEKKEEVKEEVKEETAPQKSSKKWIFVVVILLLLIITGVVGALYMTGKIKF